MFYNINDFNRTRQIIGYNDEIIGLTTLGENEKYLAVASNSEQVIILLNILYRYKYIKNTYYLFLIIISKYEFY